MKLALKEILINLGGWSSKKYKKKKGYTLIEVIVSIAISIIVMTIGTTLIIRTYRSYVNIVEENIRADSVDNALLTIDRLLTGYMITSIIPDSVNDEIKINYLIEHGKVGIKSKTIKLYQSKLRVETYRVGMSKSGNNTVLNGVKSFDVIKKKNMYYYKITLDRGGEIIHCI